MLKLILCLVFVAPAVLAADKPDEDCLKANESLTPATPEQIQREAKAASRELHEEAVHRIEAAFAAAGKTSSTDLNILKDPDHPQFLETLFATARQPNVTIEFGNEKVKGTPEVLAIRNELGRLFSRHDLDAYWTEGRRARMEYALGDAIPYDVTETRLRRQARKSRLYKVPVGSTDPKFKFAVEHLETKGLTEPKALEKADALQTTLDKMADEVRGILDKPMGSTEEKRLRVLMTQLVEGKHTNDIGFYMDDDSGFAGKLKITRKDGESLTKTLFYIFRNRVDMANIRLTAFDPDKMTINGKQPTPAERAEIWKMNFAAGLEENYHVVQDLRYFGNLSGTPINVSDWARAKRFSVSIDSEADVYAKLKEKLGALDPVYLEPYETRSFVP